MVIPFVGRFWSPWAPLNLQSILQFIIAIDIEKITINCYYTSGFFGNGGV
jgi:hypothetical protein